MGRTGHAESGPLARRGGERGAAGSRDRRLCALLLVILGAYYGVLQNGLWTPASDPALYLHIARNLVTGQGYQVGGIVPRVVPPGWPLFLAACLKVSSSFWFLNGVGVFLSLATAAFTYFSMRRLTSPGGAFAAVLGVMVLYTWYQFAYQPFGEPLFMALFSAALLLALQAGEGRGLAWRLALAAVLCVGMVAVRWNGAPACALVAAAFLSGSTRPRGDRRWAGAALICAVGVLAFVAVRATLARLPDPGALPVQVSADAPLPAQGRGTAGWDQPMPRIFKAETARELAGRLAGAGMWLSQLLWPVFWQTGYGRSAVLSLDNALGWLVIVLYGLSLPAAWRRREWLALSVPLYALPLVIRCSHPVGRYLVPIAPLTALGAWRGAAWLGGLRPSRTWSRLCTGGAAALVASALLLNLGLFAVDAWILRSPDFYGRYRGGETAELVDIAHYLDEQAVGDWEVAFNSFYVQRGEGRSNVHAHRLMLLLRSKLMLPVPPAVTPGEPNAALLEWAHARRVRYYLYRPPVSPWRIWHFRMPWLQERVTGEPAEWNPYWVLFRIEEGRAVRVHPPRARDWLTKLPALEERQEP